MAGSTESNRRMGDMVNRVSPQECPQGYEGTYPDCRKIKEVVKADVITTENPNALKPGELTPWEEKHGKLSDQDRKIANWLGKLSAKRAQKAIDKL